MKTFALILIIIGIVAVIGFSIAFFIELVRSNENEEAEEEVKAEEEEVKEPEEEAANQTQEEFDLDAMLARLEASAIAASEEEQPAEEVKEEAQEEAHEEPAQEEVQEEVQEVQEAQEEQPAEEVKEEAENEGAKLIVIKEETVIDNSKEEKKEEPQEAEVVDLSTRLASVKEAQEKVDNDLTKATRDINKYERTQRRMARNQKLLDKKAEDLTKLNLVLYSVTDIKNIDADKKQKQEELTEHINELKSSIKDAQDYLDANKEKYENSKRMQAFFEGESARLKADEAEILSLMGKPSTDETDN